MIRLPRWQAIRLPLALVVAAVVAAGAGSLWSAARMRAASDELARQKQALAQARQRLAQADRERRLLAAHLPAYRALVARGVIGAENRLAWIEAVQQANREARLYGVDYSIEPRQPAPAALAGNIPLKQSVMKLKMPLLVETDLPRFLDALKARAPGLFSVRSCRMARTPNAPFAAVNQPRLEADCELLWFTVAKDTGTTR
jgi:hypothetical protein